MQVELNDPYFLFSLYIFANLHSKHIKCTTDCCATVAAQTCFCLIELVVL